MQLFQFKSTEYNVKFRLVVVAMFQVLSSCVQLVAALLDSAGMQLVRHPENSDSSIEPLGFLTVSIDNPADVPVPFTWTHFLSL